MSLTADLHGPIPGCGLVKFYANIPWTFGNMAMNWTEVVRKQYTMNLSNFSQLVGI